MNKHIIKNCNNCKYSMFLDGNNIIHCELKHKFKKAFIEYCKSHIKKEDN